MKDLYIFPTDHTKAYVFHMMQKMNSDYFPVKDVAINV
jgi:hypothetical protein